jgi:hypothetical protein
MAAQGRGSGAAVVLAAAAALVLCVLLQEARVAESAVFTVGDRGGWSFSSNSWTNGKRFKAGDVLVFKYDSSAHNVAAVNAAGYKGCSATAPVTTASPSPAAPTTSSAASPATASPA